MSTKFLSPGWRMPRNANQSKQSNYSMDFDSSSSDYINIPNTSELQITGELSISFWIKTANTQTTITGVVSKAPITNSIVALAQYHIEFFGSNNELRFVLTGLDLQAGSETTGSVPAISLNTWEHITMTWNGSNEMIVYKNGQQVCTKTQSTTIVSNTEPVLLGKRANKNSLNGQLDGVSIFDYALSPSQVTTLWGGGTSVSNPMALPSPPIAYYPLGESAGGFVGGSGTWLTENNAIGDYVFDGYPGGTKLINSNINQSNTGGKFTVSFWQKPSGSGLVTFNHGGGTIGEFKYFSQPIVYLASNYFQYFNISTSTLNANTNWQHFVVFVDTTNVTNSKLWIDKTPIATASAGTGGSANSFTSGLQLNLGAYPEVSNMMYFTNYEINQTNVDVLYNNGSPLMSTATLTQAPNAWYKLDASEIYNSSTTEWTINDATANYKTALDFTGDGNHAGVQVASNLMSGYTDFTWSIWLNPKAFASVEYIMKAAGQTYLRHAFGNINFVVNIAGNVAGSLNVATFDTNKWSHIVALIDQSNSKIKLFVNGVLKGAGTISATGAVGSSSPFAIGTDDSLTQYPWNGLLSNTQVWNTTLTDGGASTVGDIAGGEIATLYNGGSPLTSSIPQSSNNKLWLKMDNLTTGIQDSSGNSNNGTASSEIVQVDSFVSTLNGDSSGMSQANLVQSDLQTVAPYSKYAMKLDDATLSDYINVPNNSTLQITGNLTLSSWVRVDGSYVSNGHLIAKQDSYVLKSHQSSLSNVPRFQVNDGSFHNLEGPSVLTLDTWHHIAGVRDGNSLKLYVNGALVASSTPTIGNLSVNTHPVQFNAYTSAYSSDLSLSNNAIWNVALNASEIREIYNEGLPSNLNTFSGTAPISWWQLGENSSFDGSNWKYADEMSAGNNADSVNTAETALTNGVGTTANGVSASMGVGSLVGDAPYSTANALSSGMSVVSRVSGVSDATITTGGTGYSTGTNIATTGGSGTNCTINITTVSGGAITAITINSGGNNYLIGDVLTVSGGNGNATITVSGLNTP